VVVSVKLPDVPVIVTVTVPVVALALAVNVNVLVVVAGLGLNAAVTPLGKPDAERVTLPLKPFAGVMVIALVPWAPCTTLNVLGLADSVKLGPEETVRLIVVVRVKLPEIPVTVTVAVPVGAVALAVRVRVLVLVAGLGLNAAVTPLGRPDADNVTLPVKPFAGVMVIVLVPWPPGTMLKLLGLADSVKLGGDVTVRLIVVVSVRLPEMPVTVTVAVPVDAVALAVRVRVLVLVAGLGLNAAVTPLGNPDAERVTPPLKPLAGVMVIVLVPWLPCTMLNVLGLADRVKVGVADTVRLTVVVSVRLPDVPVMVTVAVPVAAVALAVNVRVLVLVAGLGVNAAVTPFGNPDAASVTLPENPLDGVMVIVLVPWLPCSTLKLLGLADSVKLGAGVTVRLIVVVSVTLPEMPVTLTVAVPVEAVALAVSVRVLVLVAGLGLNFAVTPLGKSDADNVTLPLKPFAGVMVIVLVP
jgi:hypothetical protein